jgi:branched-chain amino acid transport system permease protein
MTVETIDTASPLERRLRGIQGDFGRVVAPLRLGWSDTKRSAGQRSGALREALRRSDPLIRALVYAIPIILVLALPQLPFVSAFYKTVLVDRVAFYVLLALGLNVVVGFAGLLDLGYVAFYAIGAYVAAWLTGAAPIPPPFGQPLDPFLTFPFAILIAMLAGVLLGLPTLRLRGDYLAIVTLGFHEIVRLSIKNADPITNGDRGINGIDQFAFPAAEASPGTYLVAIVIIGAIVAAIGGVVLLRMGRAARNLAIGLVAVGAIIAATAPVTSEPMSGFGARFTDFGLDPIPYYYLAVFICALMIFIVNRLANSRVGRGWVAIREDEIAAEAMGVPTLKLKVWAFSIGASTAGFAGVMLAVKTSFINPQYFLLLQSIIVLAMVVFGGMGSISGAIAGAIFIGFTTEALRDFDAVPFEVGFIGIGSVLAVLGVLLIVGVIRSRAGRPFGLWVLGIGVVMAAAAPILRIPFDKIGERPDEYRLFILGAILIVVMILRPEGLIPSRRRAAELHGEGVASSETLGTVEADESEVDGLATERSR